MDSKHLGNERTVTPSKQRRTIPCTSSPPEARQNRQTSRGRPSDSSQTSSVVGRVALEELVETPSKSPFHVRRKKSHGDQR